MSVDIEINKQIYRVLPNEFNTVIHNEYTNLSIRERVGEYEKTISLLNDLSSVILSKKILIFNPTHGGFIGINCSTTVVLLNVQEKHMKNIKYNVESNTTHAPRILYSDTDNDQYQTCPIIYSEKYEYIDPKYIHHDTPPILVTSLSPALIKKNIYEHIFEIDGLGLALYIPTPYYNTFIDHFHYFLDNDILKYDNLIHLCIMVKNGGPQFEDMLLKNMHLIDRWTILDTGSTDDTVEIINRILLGKKRGQLFEEPFINFRDSRNRLLELVGEECKFTLMLDDTYVIEGDLRGFLNEVRGDQIADSFTLYIKSDDVEYGSNRVLKSARQLKYKYKIHEVIQPENNMNVVIPKPRANILDCRFDYMENRTMDRKQLDLKLLFEELEDDPNNSRTHYYLAQTYNLIKDYEKAFYYFTERMNHPNEGFIQEKVDATFEAARIANFQLNRPWPECESLYLKAYELDKSRPDSLYFLGIHYYLDTETDNAKAFEYFKRAFNIGYPVHCQYSLKPTLSYHFLPKFLAQLCYEYGDFVMGEQCTRQFIDNNDASSDMYNVIVSWYNIFTKLNKPVNGTVPTIINGEDKPILCFVADGGFAPWTGEDILSKGVGGSETYIIEMARYIQRQGYFKVVVFCNCIVQSIFEDVDYIPIDDFYSFIKTVFVHTCIISRFSEYIPTAIHGNSENVYLVLHDLTPSGCIIPLHQKLKKIFCLSEWHVDYFTNLFPQCKHLTVPFYYGIDQTPKNQKKQTKQKNKFIYSSFPNRGLLPLLQMWSRIVERFPDASLHIYSDIDGEWVNSVAKDQMDQIRDILTEKNALPAQNNETGVNNENNENIYYHGWVNKSNLYEAWQTSEYWLYPCTFMETFCLTALEAALYKTCVITNGIAALENTVGNRGIIVPGDPMAQKWQTTALSKLFEIMENNEKREKLINKNYNWAVQLSWENQAEKLMNDYLSQNLLEYRGMFNWTHDTPHGTGARETFCRILDTYSKKWADKTATILEIGTYTGTSLIEMVKRVPNSRGIGLDRWMNYDEDGINILLNMEKNNIEKSFHRNVRTANLQDRISSIKGDSHNILLELLSTNQLTVDIIYVDGSHKCLDVTIDLFLSWKLLRSGGIMIIDDYLYNADKVKELPYEYPYEAVNQFLKKYEKEMIVLEKGYRVFIEKC